MFMDESLWGGSVSCMNVYCCHEHGHIKAPQCLRPMEMARSSPGQALRPVGMASLSLVLVLLLTVCRERQQSQFPSPDDCIQRLLPAETPLLGLASWSPLSAVVSKQMPLVSQWLVHLHQREQPARSSLLCIVSSFPDAQSDQV